MISTSENNSAAIRVTARAGGASFLAALVILVATPRPAQCAGSSDADLLQEIVATRLYVEALVESLEVSVSRTEYFASGVAPYSDGALRRRVQERYIFDRQGRLFAEELYAILDERGEVVSTEPKFTHFFDLTRGGILTQVENGGRTVQLTPDEHISKRRNVLSYYGIFGESLAQRISAAQEAGLSIDVQQVATEENGSYVLSVPSPGTDGTVYRVWVDAQKCFYPFRMEAIEKGVLRSRVTSTAAMFQGDIWLPVEAEDTTFSPDGDGEVRSNSDMRFEVLRLNLADTAWDDLFRL
ncbi:MAG: hypothetical protein ACOX5J_05860 [Candidatus Hydrogenedentales bacterium]|jgi:hypothetical protein